jgi:hypothetical protein
MPGSRLVGRLSAFLMSGGEPCGGGGEVHVGRRW